MSLDAMVWAKTVKTGRSSAKAVLTWLADMCGADHTAYPSINALVEATELDKKTVQASLQHLVAIGLIRDTGERRGRTKQIPVWYLQGITESVADAEQTQKRDGSRGKRKRPKNGNIPENGTVSGSEDNQRIPFFPSNDPKNGIRNLPRNLKDKDLFLSGNSDESPNEENLADFKSCHPDAEVFTPSGKSWGSKQDLECAAWIFERVKVINPSARQPNWTEWANDVRLIRQIDGRTHREIAGLFLLAHRDSFWCRNILSPSKLRAKWDDLTIKLGGQQHANNSGESTAVRQIRAERQRWELERRGTSLAPLGTDGANLRQPLDAEEWEQADPTVDHPDWEYDQRPDDERL